MATVSAGAQKLARWASKHTVFRLDYVLPKIRVRGFEYALRTCPIGVRFEIWEGVNRIAVGVAKTEDTAKERCFKDLIERCGGSQ